LEQLPFKKGAGLILEGALKDRGRAADFTKKRGGFQVKKKKFQRSTATVNRKVRIEGGNLSIGRRHFTWRKGGTEKTNDTGEGMQKKRPAEKEKGWNSFKEK